MRLNAVARSTHLRTAFTAEATVTGRAEVVTMDVFIRCGCLQIEQPVRTLGGVPGSRLRGQHAGQTSEQRCNAGGVWRPVADVGPTQHDANHQ